MRIWAGELFLLPCHLKINEYSESLCEIESLMHLNLKLKKANVKKMSLNDYEQDILLEEQLGQCILRW